MMNRPAAEKLNKFLYNSQLRLFILILFDFSSETRLKLPGVSVSTTSIDWQDDSANGLEMS